ncbi:hypothetical protein ES702_06672 [subsurface metagenome]
MSECYAVKDGFGFKRGELIGDFRDGQLLVNLPETKLGEVTLEEAVAKLAALPDTFIMRNDEGHILCLGELRKTLRGAARSNPSLLPIATVGWFPDRTESDDGNGLFPLGIEEAAEAWLQILIEQIYDEVEIRGDIAFIVIEPGSLQESRCVRLKVVTPEPKRWWLCDVIMRLRDYYPEQWVCQEIKIIDSAPRQIGIWQMNLHEPQGFHFSKTD